MGDVFIVRKKIIALNMYTIYIGAIDTKQHGGECIA